jgi:hypothetical protein
MEDEKHIIHDHSLGFAEIYSSIISAQAELTNPVKDTKGHNYKYAGLDQVITLLREVLPKHGLWFEQNLQDTPDRDNHITVETFIIHKSGQRTQPSYFTMPVEEARGMNSNQAHGCSITYAKRYALATVFALASEEDTDGVIKNSANAKAIEKPKKKPAVSPYSNEATLVDQCEAKLIDLKLEDWATAISYIPKDSKEERNKKFLRTKVETLQAQATQWRKENG